MMIARRRFWYCVALIRESVRAGGAGVVRLISAHKVTPRGNDNTNNRSDWDDYELPEEYDRQGGDMRTFLFAEEEVGDDPAGR